MIAEWYLFLALWAGNAAAPGPVPMASLDACTAAARNYHKTLGGHSRSFTACINTKAGEVVKP